MVPLQYVPEKERSLGRCIRPVIDRVQVEAERSLQLQ